MTALDLKTRQAGAEGANHYHVMRRAIDAIDAAGGTPLTLDALAGEVNMSPAHFQRVFSKWVGVSPKRYQQYLTIDHARALLRDKFTMLEAANSLGLSGTGRLHDLFLTWEAMSPGDYAKGGEGLTIRWGWFDSPFDLALVMATDRGICGLAFAAETGAEAAIADMLSRWPKATFVEDPMAIRPDVTAAFDQTGEARLHMIGAPFQIKGWATSPPIPKSRARSATPKRSAPSAPPWGETR